MNDTIVIDLNNVAADSAVLTGEACTEAVTVKGGGNNQIFRITTASGKVFALKRYVADLKSGTSERILREFNGIRFLVRQGFTDVPVAHALDDDRKIALYDWIEGHRVQEHTPERVDALADFVSRLSPFRRPDHPGDIIDAREATLETKDYLTQNFVRLDILEGQADMPIAGFSALLKDLKTALDGLADNLVEDLGERLAPPAHVLSPSDFGFHNALLSAGGTLTFLDMEYFGWDDPIRLVADTMQHPGTALGDELAARFYYAVRPQMAFDPTFQHRIARLYGLLAVRWACIILNEFLPAVWERRVEAGQTRERREVLEQQLDKAKAHLERHTKLIDDL